MILFTIIGDIGTNFARILTEVGHEGVLNISLLDVKKKKIIFIHFMNVYPKIPFIIPLLELTDNTAYTLDLSFNNKTKQINFTTWSNYTSDLNVFVIGHNDVNNNNYILWNYLAKYHNPSNNNNICIHTSKQNYSDHIYQKYKDMTYPELLDNYDNILNEYRDLYRQSYSEYNQNKVMASMSNLMIDKTPYLSNDTIAKAKHQVYLEYEIQLFRDIDNDILRDITGIYYYKIIGKHGFIFIDLYNQDNYLTENLKLWLNYTIKNHMNNSQIEVLYLVTTMEIHNYSGWSCNKKQDYEYVLNDTNYLIKLLNIWCETNNGHAFILSSNKSEGGFTEFYINDELVVTQVFSGPISQTPHKSNNWLIKSCKAIKDFFNCTDIHKHIISTENSVGIISTKYCRINKGILTKNGVIPIN
jgi:hypothetical protein